MKRLARLAGRIGDLPPVGRDHRRKNTKKIPLNRLLSRGPRFRMDAEMIRDAALSSSGMLVAKLGGPSVKPYQPEGVWEAVAMPESNTHDYRARSRRATLPPRPLHTLETKRTACLARHLQRTFPRGLHRPQRANQHAPPGTGHAQRPPVRRGGPGPGSGRTRAGWRNPRAADRLHRPAAAGTPVPPRRARSRSGVARQAERLLPVKPR